MKTYDPFDKHYTNKTTTTKDKRSRQNCSLLLLMLQIQKDTQVKEAREMQNLQKGKLW